MNLERNSEIKSLESEIKTLREENKGLRKVIEDMTNQTIDLWKKELEIYKPAYERHIKEIESLKLELLEKDKKIKEAFEAGESYGWNSRSAELDGKPIGRPNWETFAKENNITYTKE